jgi:hypothetical protein
MAFSNDSGYPDFNPAKFFAGIAARSAVRCTRLLCD